MKLQPLLLQMNAMTDQVRELEESKVALEAESRTTNKFNRQLKSQLDDLSESTDTEIDSLRKRAEILGAKDAELLRLQEEVNLKI